MPTSDPAAAAAVAAAAQQQQHHQQQQQQLQIRMQQQQKQPRTPTEYVPDCLAGLGEVDALLVGFLYQHTLCSIEQK
jgi:hypothetical protein